MICARGLQQQDGTILVALDPAIADLATCQYVVSTAGELANGLPLNLSLTEGMQIGFAMWTLLATAWAFKQVGRLISGVNHVAEAEE